MWLLPDRRIEKPGSAPGLLDRPRTGDEDIDQSPRALLPVRAGRNIGNADQSAKEIDRVKVFTYVAAFDGAFRQRAHPFFPNLCVRSFEHPLGISIRVFSAGAMIFFAAM